MSWLVRVVLVVLGIPAVVVGVASSWMRRSEAIVKDV
jgi:hypothetical protein